MSTPATPSPAPDAAALTARIVEDSRSGRHADAERLCRAAASLAPGEALIQFNHGVALWNLGRVDEAAGAFARTLALDPLFPGARLNLAIAQLAPVYRDEDDLLERRRRYERLLKDWCAHALTAHGPAAAAEADSLGGAPPFKLAYQGMDDRDLQRAYGQALCALMARRHPHWAARPAMPSPDADGRLRIGIASAFFYGHSNWKMPLAGWLKGLPRDRFRLFGYHLRDIRDAATAEAESLCDRFVQGARPLEEWAETIRGDGLHVLIHPEIGMSRLGARLAALRLAPVQCTSWGHPTTSGMPSVDAFLSSDLMEPPGAEAHYTEALVRLPNLSIAYHPPAIAPLALTRADLGLAEGEVLFWCCQNLMKYLPQHDHVFADIAAADPAFRMVFIEDANASVTAAFRARIERAFAALGLRAEDRCTFLPRLGAERFAAATRLMDLFLDSIGWSGCNSLMEAFGQGLPAVCFAGDTLRARHGGAMLSMMGLPELAVSDKAAYVALAVRLGRESGERRRLAGLIAGRRERLYADRAAIDGLARFLEETCAGNGPVGAATRSRAGAEAYEHHKAGRQDAAEPLYRRALVERPADGDALAGLGALCLQRERTADAIPLLERAVRVRPELAKAHLNLGTAYRKAERHFDAAEAYRAAAAVDPGLVFLPDAAPPSGRESGPTRG